MNILVYERENKMDFSLIGTKKDNINVNFSFLWNRQDKRAYKSSDGK